MKLSIIIVNYNTKDLVKDCIDSVKKSISGIDYEIIVVDNNSQDGSVELLKNYPGVEVIANRVNAGFAKANNQGYSISRGQYVLLLNNDTIIVKDAINKLVDFLDANKEAAIVGPRLLNRDLTLQLPCRRSFPRFINSLAYFTGLSRLFPGNRMLGSYLMTYMDDKKTHEVDAASGACMMIRRECIGKIGGLLDEDFFMHFEDIDLCYRARKHGYKVFYKHDAEVVHLKGQSSRMRKRQVKAEFYKSARVYFQKNYKHENFIGYFFLVALIVQMQLLSTVAYKFRNAGKRVYEGSDNRSNFTGRNVADKKITKPGL